MVISDRTKSQLFANDQYLIRIAQGSLAPGKAAIHKKPNKNGTPWSAEEHERFLLALERFPSGPWKIIASYVMTRTTRQTMTHAQKYREKITRMKRTMEESAPMQPLGRHSPMSKQPHFAPPCNSTSGIEGIAPKTEEFEVVEDGDFLLSCSEIDEMFNATLLTLFDADEPNLAILLNTLSNVASRNTVSPISERHRASSAFSPCRAANLREASASVIRRAKQPAKWKWEKTVECDRQTASERMGGGAENNAHTITASVQRRRQTQLGSAQLSSFQETPGAERKMAISIAIPAESARYPSTSVTPERQHKQQQQHMATATATAESSSRQPTEVFLPASIRREMLGFFSMEELLKVEQVDALWRRALRDAGQWTRFSLTHDNDAQRNNALLRRMAISHGADVERLELINCVFSNELVLELGARFTNLKELVVSGCKMLTDEAFAVLVRASTQRLVEVRAVKCPLLTDDSLDAMGAFQAQSIERVDFSHCRLLSSQGIERLLAQNCEKLSSIGLKGCPKVNDTAVVAIATRCASNLRALFVGGSGNVSDSALQALATHCANLEALDIARSNPFGGGRGCVSDQALLHFVSKCRNLERLVLRGQGQLSLAVLASISAHCPKLQSLDIGGCRQIIEDPVALGAELKSMSLLEQLSVSFARGLNDSHISSIAAQCPQLKRFDVDGAQVAVASCV